MESNQDTLYHKWYTRRLGLTLIPKEVISPSRTTSHFITCITSSSGKSDQTGRFSPRLFLLYSLFSLYTKEPFTYFRIVLISQLLFLIEVNYFHQTDLKASLEVKRPQMISVKITVRRDHQVTPIFSLRTKSWNKFVLDWCFQYTQFLGYEAPVFLIKNFFIITAITMFGSTS